MDHIEKLMQAALRFEGDCAKADQARWTARPNGVVWSMAQVAEHVTITNGILAGTFSRLKPLGDRVLGVIDDEIPYLFYRGEEPTEFATPIGDWTDWNSRAGLFRASVARLEQECRQLQAPRTVGASHPIFGLLDGVQWLMFASAHIERHRAQLIGLMATGARS
jgi:uncharacterized damage-inducible protein DinB